MTLNRGGGGNHSFMKIVLFIDVFETNYVFNDSKNAMQPSLKTGQGITSLHFNSDANMPFAILFAKMLAYAIRKMNQNDWYS